MCFGMTREWYDWRMVILIFNWELRLLKNTSSQIFIFTNYWTLSKWASPIHWKPYLLPPKDSCGKSRPILYLSGSVSHFVISSILNFWFHWISFDYSFFKSHASQHESDTSYGSNRPSHQIRNRPNKLRPFLNFLAFSFKTIQCKNKKNLVKILVDNSILSASNATLYFPGYIWKVL